MSDVSYRSFSEFWPFYLSQHANPFNRALHVVGTLVAVIVFIGFITSGKYLWAPLCLALGYGPAWVGHYVIEKNRPATFKYPVWSLMGDFLMCFYYLTGRFEQINKHLK